MKNYDLIVIGGGGGTKLVSPPAALGLKVAVIEKEALGGTCLNRGCIPSKMLIHPADVAAEIDDAHRINLKVGKYSIDWSTLVRRVNRDVTRDSKSIGKAYNKNKNIDYYHHQAKFISNKVLEVNGKKITAKKIFIATGARPRIPNIPGLEGTPFMTSTEALRNTKQPKKMIVIGGGYIGAELGHFYGSLGTEVHVLVRNKMVNREDGEIINEFEKQFSKRYKTHFGINTKEVQYKNNKFTVIIEKRNGKRERLKADALLVATGVVPNSDTLSIENSGIKVDKRGFIKVNKFLETAAKDVYALGDVVGNFLFRHSVNFEGEYLFDRLYISKKRRPIKYPPMPHAIFSHPQIGGVGFTEDELIKNGKKAGKDYVVGRNNYINSAMGSALRSDHGFVKLIFDAKNQKLIGAHIIGPEASNMIHIAIAFMTARATLNDVLGIIYVHPALPEILRNAARKAKAKLDQKTKR
jgi:mycothione reductase